MPRRNQFIDGYFIYIDIIEKIALEESASETSAGQPAPACHQRDDDEKCQEHGKRDELPLDAGQHERLGHGRRATRGHGLGIGVHHERLGGGTGRGAPGADLRPSRRTPATRRSGARHRI